MLDQIRQMGERLNLNEGQITAACTAYTVDPEWISGQAVEARKNGNVKSYRQTIREDARFGGAQALAAALLMACEAEKEYQKYGIPIEVFDSTMSDIKIWADRYRRETGFDGLGEINWIVKHCRLEIFRLGRLQFERTKVNYLPLALLFHRSSIPVRRGQRCLGVHIPEGEKLNISACEDSFARAPEFFRKFFPQEKYVCFTCLSWLLSSVYARLLPESSNIVRFRELWDIARDIRGDSQAIERIWGKRERDAENYRRDTLLQREAAAWLAQGKRLGMGFGLRMIK